MRFCKQIIIVLLVLVWGTSLKAQESSESAADSSSNKLPLSYSAGVGIFTYRGDIGKVEGLGTTENFEAGYFLSAEYLLKNTLGLSLGGFYGNISKNERNELSNRNFKSNLIGVEFNATFHFANGFILSENYPIDPFISAGANFLMFTPKKDVLDPGGNQYFYWSDGSIRSQIENVANLATADILTRDYEYETEIEIEGESNSTIAFPVSLGVNFRINNYLSSQLKHSTYILTTDFVDGHVAGKANDMISFSSLGLTFKPAGYKKGDKDKKDEFDEIDFASLLKSDSDADGVLDIDDWCQETDESVEVDKHGCPLDKDNDGVADNKDKETDTKAEVLQIDSNGVGVADSIVALEALDTVVTLREELCAFYPSMCQGDESDIEFQLLNRGKADKSLLNSKVEISKRPIEEIKTEADINKDGRISAKEIYENIDKYFDGEVDLTLGDIHKLIDYFFEQ